MMSHGFGDVFAPSGHMPHSIVPLANKEIQSFIRDGFLCVTPTGLGVKDHATLTQVVNSLREEPDGAHWRGNNCYPSIPELGHVLSDPAVHGALTALLGPGYALHPHRHVHISEPGNTDQGIHQDSYEDDRSTRHHRPRWVMVMYYPHDVTPEDGPTAVVPQSHWYNDPGDYIIAEGIGPTHVDDAVLRGDYWAVKELKPGISPRARSFGRSAGPSGHHVNVTDEWHAAVSAGTVVIIQ